MLERHLAEAARRVIEREKPEVIAVTGSVGKSSAKQAVAAALRGKFTVRATPGNFNTEIGLPLTVLDLPSGGSSRLAWLKLGLMAWMRSHRSQSGYPKKLVLEMAADKPGDLGQLCDIAAPNVAVVTTVGESHLQAFKNVEAIEKEKGTIVDRLTPQGLAVLNRDDERVWKMRTRTKAQVVSFGFHEEADVRGVTELTAPVLDADRVGMRFKVQAGGSTVPFFLPGVLGQHSLYGALAAVAVGLHEGMNLIELSDALMQYDAAPGRMRLLPGIKRTFLIDDTYNAAPRSVMAALETLRDLPLAAADDKRFAVLGDMRELGDDTTRMHAEVGAKAAECADVVVLVGELMVGAERAAKIAGADEGRVFHFATAREAGRFVQERMKQGDAVLVKGSRAMEMERVVKELMAEPQRAAELLVKTHADW
jgi:UDP-N-acetylmuramoyl-tripeptide--D-alanyl-D-alanine ligase